MNILIEPSSLNGKIDAILSKSDVHRLLICSALSNEPTRLEVSEMLSKDIESTIFCLESFGAKIEIERKTKKEKEIKKNDKSERVRERKSCLIVTPNEKKIKENFIMDCGESGSTLRFLLPVAATFGTTFKIVGHGRLPQRPIFPLINAMKKNGCKFSSESIPTEVSGRLKSGVFKLRGDVSSQYISGLLFALPLLKGDSHIILTSPLESAGYLRMTINALNLFSVNVEQNDNEIHVSGTQSFKSPHTVTAQGDWSNAAFWLTAGALSGEIEVQGLLSSSYQEDKNITKILSSMGACVVECEDSVRVRRGELHSISLDASDVPDLVPIVAVAMSVASGKSTIYNVGRLRFKESDRLKAITKALNSIGAKVIENEDYLEIYGKERLVGGVVDSFNDHRIVMAMAIASIMCDNRVEIKNFQTVEKSYPNFFNDFKLLGGICNVI